MTQKVSSDARHAIGLCWVRPRRMPLLGSLLDITFRLAFSLIQLQGDHCRDNKQHQQPCARVRVRRYEVIPVVISADNKRNVEARTEWKYNVGRLCCSIKPGKRKDQASLRPLSCSGQSRLQYFEITRDLC
jgi:hypothetical protein